MLHNTLTRGAALLACVVVAILLGSCSSKWERKLSEKKLEQLFIEFYTTPEILKKVDPNMPDSSKLAVQRIILSKYHITPAEFDSIVTYYAHYKADRLAVITEKAYTTIQTQLSQLEHEEQRLKVASNIYNMTSLTFQNIPTFIPKGYFPRYLSAQPNGSYETLALSVTDSIEANSQIEVSLKVRGDLALQQTAPSFAVAYFASDSTYSQQQSLTRAGAYTARLTFHKKVAPAPFAVFIFSETPNTALPIYVESLEIKTTKEDK